MRGTWGGDSQGENTIGYCPWVSDTSFMAFEADVLCQGSGVIHISGNTTRSFANAGTPYSLHTYIHPCLPPPEHQPAILPRNGNKTRDCGQESIRRVGACPYRNRDGAGGGGGALTVLKDSLPVSFNVGADSWLRARHAFAPTDSTSPPIHGRHWSLPARPSVLAWELAL